ncbi:MULTISPECIES: hypothetical protein [unclassified Cryobacterium]|uniref:hypothetical protein n=1 Tax=unclassified Cryobacterium TaxID=2649013 RepID=UPI00106AC1A7|nr:MULTISPECIES: hypothetical protein [unclassified Cryobacterium]TFC59448.1 hypothetical protein E3O68_00680 [Cryobacterium sp. TMB3-1-2]TFC67244.1 hypothetical protein E3T21_17375 [Cryobacterium sp. TMB3-15]TFC73243.1 hypothetical protein E3T22_16680 [Cryobacterium sp. TMB3-10]TFD46131.1 hypothetical protein E3T58_01315 [Cryobacterium sp. TMB3-12]
MTARDDVNARKVERLTAQLAKERGHLALMTKANDTINAHKATENTDPAQGSGIRRKPNAKADTRRFNAYDREATISIAQADAEKEVARLESAIAAATTERFRVLLTRYDLAGAKFIRDEFGWHEVVRVNAVTVSVKTPYSWTDKIPFDRVLEARK